MFLTRMGGPFPNSEPLSSKIFIIFLLQGLQMSYAIYPKMLLLLKPLPSVVQVSVLQARS